MKRIRYCYDVMKLHVLLSIISFIRRNADEVTRKRIDKLIERRLTNIEL